MRQLDAYLTRIEAARSQTVHRAQLACGNLAHGLAAYQPGDKAALKSLTHSDICHYQLKSDPYC